MTLFESKIDSRSPEFQANAAQLRAAVEDLQTQMAQVALGGGEKARSCAALAWNSGLRESILDSNSVMPCSGVGRRRA